MKSMYSTPYIAPTLVVDAVLFQIVDDQLCVLLVKRSQDPYKDSWALPGGYCPKGETTLDALQRITATKAGVNIKKDTSYVEQLYTFDTVARDPRGHAVSVVYLACGLSITCANSATEETGFFPIDDLPNLAYDHADIINYAHNRLKGKITYTNAVYSMMPKLFTLTQLQTTYESILGSVLDKRNFRKKFLQLDLISGTGQKIADGAHRPAQLFTFNQQKLQTLTRSFD
jgi:8-oxo-dGTP diphosphatase